MNCSTLSPGVCIGDPITTGALVTTLSPTSQSVTSTLMGNTTAQRCPATCGNSDAPMTCEEVMGQFGMTCAEASLFQGGCDCSTCDACLPGNTTVQTTSMTSEASLTTIDAVCPKTCLWNRQGLEYQTCNYFRQTTSRTCAEMEVAFGCDCTGCRACENATTTADVTTSTTTTTTTTTIIATTTPEPFDHGDCPVTCGDPQHATSCNEIAYFTGMSCPDIERSQGCNCTGCTGCVTTTVISTTTTTTLNTTTAELFTTTSETCLPSCGANNQFSCEDLMRDRGWTCTQAEESGGCDCMGCYCPTTTTTTTGITSCYAVCDPERDYTRLGASGPCGGPDSAACCAEGGEFIEDELGMGACFCTEEVCGEEGFFCRNCDEYLTTTQPVCPMCPAASQFGGPQNCDDLIQSQGVTCEGIENLYGCSCFGCQCNELQSTTPYPQSSTTPPARCPAECGLDSLSCDELISIDNTLFGNQSNTTCESIEAEYGCSCTGCACGASCEATCGDRENPSTCDQLLEQSNQFDTCEEIEIYFNTNGSRRVRRDLQVETTSIPESTNDACYTTNQGLVDCVNFMPPGVCCSLLQGQESVTRCMPAEQCSRQDGTYVGQTTLSITTGSEVTSSGVTIAQSNSACLTSNQGLLNCLTREPPSVCCSTLEGAQNVVRCSPIDQCINQGGSILSDDFSTLLVTQRSTTDLGGTTVLVQRNTACVTSQGTQNCVNAQPSGVCCTLTEGEVVAARCMPSMDCEFQNGEYPAGDTTEEMNQLTTSNPMASQTNNSACITDIGVEDCLNSQPPGVCCTLLQGDRVATRCMPDQQCEIEGGSYPNDKTRTTLSGLTNAISTSSFALVQSNTACMTSTFGEQNCLMNMPPGICCTLQEGSEMATRCMSEQQCSSQEGWYPSDATTTEEGHTRPDQVSTTSGILVQTNRECHTDQQGVMDCLDLEPPSVCCTLLQGDIVITRCMESLQCEQQEGVYPPETSSSSTTTTVTERPNDESTVSTMVVVIQSNEACISTNEGQLNCSQAQPVGVCCTILQGDRVVTRCTPEEQCIFQGGAFPRGSTTTVTATAFVTDGSTTTTMDTTRAVTTTGTTSNPFNAYTNEECSTTNQGLRDCTSQAPPGVCCTVQEGQNIVTRCSMVQQCETQNGIYPGMGSTSPPQVTIPPLVCSCRGCSSCFKVRTTTPEPSSFTGPTTTPEVCPSECGDPDNPQTCDEIHRNTNPRKSCSEIETQMQCSCYGCEACANDTTTSTTTTTELITSGVPTTLEECPRECGNPADPLNCDEVLESFEEMNSCAQIENQLACSCRGCSTCEEPTTTTTFDGTLSPNDPSCAKNCGNPANLESCNTMLLNFQGMTCEQFENDLGCDCSGCSLCNVSTTARPSTSSFDRVCEQTCFDPVSAEFKSCDEIRFENPEFTCSLLESQMGCSCRGCSTCEQNITTTTIYDPNATTFSTTTTRPECPADCSPPGAPPKNCDDVLQVLFDMTCPRIESLFSCDCYGCSLCDNYTTTTTTSTSPEPRTTDEDYVRTTTVPGCWHSNCTMIRSEGQTCDDIVNETNFAIQCPFIESFGGCDCRGCDCELPPIVTQTTGDSTVAVTLAEDPCVAECDVPGFVQPISCNTVRRFQHKNCSEIEAAYGCSCADCDLCDVEVNIVTQPPPRTTTTTISNFTSTTTFISTATTLMLEPPRLSNTKCNESSNPGENISTIAVSTNCLAEEPLRTCCAILHLGAWHVGCLHPDICENQGGVFEPITTTTSTTTTGTMAQSTLHITRSTPKIVVTLVDNYTEPTEAAETTTSTSYAETTTTPISTTEAQVSSTEIVFSASPSAPGPNAPAPSFVTIPSPTTIESTPPGPTDFGFDCPLFQESLSCAGLCGFETLDCGGCSCQASCLFYADCCSDWELECSSVSTTDDLTSSAPISSSIAAESTTRQALQTSSSAPSDLVHSLSIPQFQVTSGSSIFAGPIESSTNGVVFTSEVDVTSINQRSDFSYSFSVEGMYTVKESDLSTAKGKRSAVSVVVMTRTVHEDSPFIVARVWLDGQVYGKFSGSAVQIVIVNDAFSQTINCGSVSQHSGKTCSGTLSDTWFSSSQSGAQVHAKISGTDSVSASHNILLEKSLAFAAPDDLYMWLQLPQYKLLPGSSFSASLHANTKDSSGDLYALGTWVATLGSLSNIQLEDVSSDMYDVSYSAVDGIVSMVSTFKSSFSDSTDSLTGEILLAEFTFSVSETLNTSLLSNAFSLFIDDMVSISSNKKIDDLEGLVYSIAGFGETGVLNVESAFATGLLLYVDGSSEQDLLNTAVLSGTSITSRITKKEVWSCHTAGSVSCSESTTLSTLNGDIACESSDTNTLSVTSNCDAVLSGEENPGNDGEVSVVANYSNFSRTISFRVWYPSSLAIEVVDPVLDAIESSCDTPVFQQSAFAVVGAWTCGDECGTTDVLDLTRLASVQSSDENTVTVSNNFAIGLKVGTASLMLPNGLSTGLVVSDAFVDAVEMYTAVVNDVAIITGYDQSQFDDFATTTLTATARHSLTQEGDVAHVFPYVRFSDGHTLFVGASANLSLWDTSYIIPVADDPTAIEIQVGALSVKGDGLLKVSWLLCDHPVISSMPFFDISMPAVTAVVLTSNNGVIVSEEDSLQQPPVNFPSSAELKAVLWFEDGSSRDMSTDPRTVFSSSELNVNIHGHVVSIPSADSVTELEITASFGSMTNITSAISIKVDTFSSLTLNSAAYPACALPACAGKTTISVYEASEIYYQQLSFSLTAESSLGEEFVFSLDENTEVTISDVAVLSLSASDDCETSGILPACTLPDGILADMTLVGISAGTANVEAVWSEQTATLEVEVVDNTVSPTQISITSPSSSYVSGVQFTEKLLQLSVTFSDGTSLTKIKAGTEIGKKLPPFSSYLVFSSDDNDVLGVSSTGVLSLNANSIGSDAVTIAVASIADGAVAGSVSLFCNLEPDCYDVDLGRAREGPFDFQLDDETFEVPIFINMCNEALTNFQIQIFFDSDVIRAVSGGDAASEDWPYTVTYTYGSPASMVQLISSEPSSDIKGSIHLTTLRFEKVSSGATDIGGVVVESLGDGGALIGTSDRPFIAGSGFIVLGNSRRLREKRAVVQPHRSLANDCDNVGCGCGGAMLFGDVSGDCKFTVSDLDFFKRYMVGDTDNLVWHDESYQLSQMDPDHNGLVDGVDVGFILFALAKKYRFLAVNDTISGIDDNCAFSISVVLLDDTGARVADETTTSVVADIHGLGLMNYEFENDGQSHVFVPMNLVDNAFQLSLPLNAASNQVEIAFLVETYEEGGSTDAQRRFPWWGSEYEEYGDAGFAFTPFFRVDVPSACIGTSVLGTTLQTVTATTATITTLTTTTTTRSTSTTTTTERIETTHQSTNLPTSSQTTRTDTSSTSTLAPTTLTTTTTTMLATSSQTEETGSIFRTSFSTDEFTAPTPMSTSSSFKDGVSTVPIDSTTTTTSSSSFSTTTVTYTSPSITTTTSTPTADTTQTESDTTFVTIDLSPSPSTSQNFPTPHSTTTTTSSLIKSTTMDATTSQVEKTSTTTFLIDDTTTTALTTDTITTSAVIDTTTSSTIDTTTSLSVIDTTTTSSVIDTTTTSSVIDTTTTSSVIDTTTTSTVIDTTTTSSIIVTTTSSVLDTTTTSSVLDTTTTTSSALDTTTTSSVLDTTTTSSVLDTTTISSIIDTTTTSSVLDTTTTLAIIDTTTTSSVIVTTTSSSIIDTTTTSSVIDATTTPSVDTTKPPTTTSTTTSSAIVDTTTTAVQTATATAADTTTHKLTSEPQTSSSTSSSTSFTATTTAQIGPAPSTEAISTRSLTPPGSSSTTSTDFSLFSTTATPIEFTQPPTTLSPESTNLVDSTLTTTTFEETATASLSTTKKRTATTVHRLTPKITTQQTPSPVTSLQAGPSPSSISTSTTASSSASSPLSSSSSSSTTSRLRSTLIATSTSLQQTNPQVTSSQVTPSNQITTTPSKARTSSATRTSEYCAAAVGKLSWVGDGFCDGDFNTAQCGWDSGDCCESMCTSSADYNCGINGFDCLDPAATTVACRDASIGTNCVTFFSNQVCF